MEEKLVYKKIMKVFLSFFVKFKYLVNALKKFRLYKILRKEEKKKNLQKPAWRQNPLAITIKIELVLAMFFSLTKFNLKNYEKKETI